MGDLVGDTVRGYEIKERIGSGGYGVVYRALQPSVDREVAIKLILPERAKSEYFFQRFDAEARLVAKLEHPHIVPLYDYWREEDTAFLVMRWLEGGSLRDVLEDGSLSLESTLQMLNQIGDALTLAHDNNVVHRDLKPGNILVDAKNNYYLTDFGIAKDLKGVITAKTTGGQVTGTPAYLSPEQGMGKKVAHQSDIYSLGVVIYELLTGEHPFPEADPTTQIIHHISDPLPTVSTIREDLPVAIDNVIEIATAKEPAQRYDSIGQFVDAFQEASGLSTTTAAKSIPGILEKKLGIKPYIPAFLSQDKASSDTPREIFVGRERHLAKLDKFFQKAVSKKTQIVFVTGEAGRGKTALIQEFARRAETYTDNLIVAQGGSSLYTGVADPYLPFRQVLAMLTGDVESQLTSGEITLNQALKLWDLIPEVCQSLVNTSPDLLDTFISARELAARAAGFNAKGSPWQSQLAHLLVRKQEEGFTAESGQSQLYHQYIQVLKQLSQVRPLFILLDDLHWIDQASLGLLVAIGHELKTCPILFVGAYRDEEIQDREEGAHPLESLLSEFKRQFGDIWIDLDKSKQAEDLAFVDEYLDSEPNKLSINFRQALSKHTHGHALFTKELLRDLQERGELIKDEQARWVEKHKDIIWGHLPARVEGVIEKRIERLSKDDRRILEVASIEGERFSAEVVANVLERDTHDLIDHISSDFERHHQLVEDLGVEKLNGKSVSRFRFSHGLLQSYLYNRVTESRRISTHKTIAGYLEQLYAGHTEDIAGLLAKHFELAGEVERSIEYNQQAGDRARLAYANKEAQEYYRTALQLVARTEDIELAARLQMKLAITYQNAFDFKAANQASQLAFELWNRSLGRKSPGENPKAPHALRILAGNPLTLDPALANEDRSIFVIYQLFSGLVEGNSENEILPAIASSWEILEDGCKYVFKLRDDISWSDGVKVRASDFEFAYKRVLDPETNAGSPEMLVMIKNGQRSLDGNLEDGSQLGVNAVDELTLEIELEDPTSNFLSLLADSAASPVPQHKVIEHGDAWSEIDKIVTNGPFRLISWEKGKSLALERRLNYAGRFPGNLHRVELGLLDPDDPEKEYIDGRLDRLVLDTRKFHPSEVHRLRQKYANEYHYLPSLLIRYFGLNTRQPPFNDLRVRQALAFAIDKEHLAGEVLLGLVAPGTGGFIPPGMPGHVNGIGVQFDPEEARRLLNEAGYPSGKDFPMTKALVAENYKLEANFLQSQWRRELGVEIEIELFDIKGFMEKKASEIYNIFVAGWIADYPDPYNILVEAVEFITSGRWQHPVYTELLDNARQTLDQQKRIKYYQKADQILMNEVNLIPLHYGGDHILLKPWVKNYDENRLKNLTIESH